MIQQWLDLLFHVKQFKRVEIFLVNCAVNFETIQKYPFETHFGRLPKNKNELKIE